jgi:hypothetical protein
MSIESSTPRENPKDTTAASAKFDAICRIRIRAVKTSPLYEEFGSNKDFFGMICGKRYFAAASSPRQAKTLNGRKRRYSKKKEENGATT